MFKLLVLGCLAVAAAAVPQNPLHIQRYHELVGIPTAIRIKEAEDAAILSGMTPNTRIIGGQPAPLGAHPYLVAVLIYFGTSTSACGSSLLSATRAITAAHCWVDSWRQADRFTMVYGSEYLFYGGVRVDTTDVVVHEGWDPVALTLEYDLCMVRFNSVTFTPVIQPITLPSGTLETSDFVGVWADASGYGLIGDGVGIQTNQVQSHVTLQVIPNSLCQVYFSPVYVTERIICTDGTGPRGICSSDSGGPLSIISNNQRVLIGVVSFGAYSCEIGHPSGFVRVNAHLPWIRSNL